MRIGIATSERVRYSVSASIDGSKIESELTSGVK